MTLEAPTHAQRREAAIEAAVMLPRRHRNRMAGWFWLALGAAILAGFFWMLIVRRSVSVPLLLGLGPFGYGMHLLRLADGREPAIEPPQFFGKKP